MQALIALARAQRQRFAAVPLVAVTGSNGKTTTKEMVAAILRAWCGADAVLATQGNFNNRIGVPLTLLQLNAAHRLAVLELGMNHPGEIAELASWAAPAVGLVNNAQREHQEFMHSVAAVAQENGAVIAALPPDGVAVFPGDDPHAGMWRALAAGRRVMTFGWEATNTVYARDVQLGADGARFDLDSPAGRVVVRLPMPGRHNVLNALAAAACALALDCPLAFVAQGLASFQAVKGRLVTHLLPNDSLAIDDTYNANPDSVRAAIDVLAGLPGPRALVLGDMGEVGELGPAMHAEVGAYARERGIDRLWTMGEATRATARAFGMGASHADRIEDVVRELCAMAPAAVLFKGSRFMKMERVLAAYQAALSGSPGGDHAA